MSGMTADRAARIRWAAVLEAIGDPEPTQDSRAIRTMAIWATIADGGHARAEAMVRAGRLDLSAAERARFEAVDPARQEEIARRLGARILTPADEEWPGAVDDLRHPPHCLWVTGPASLGGAVDRSVAVVGARAATAYGSEVARALGHGLADRGFVVVSGGAFGIDGMAHRGALSAGGTTIALLACGIDQRYPSSHSGLLDEIARTGALVSEQPPGARPLRHRFLTRNRLIAALSRGVIVVEAGRRSGSLNTARHADEIGRPLAAVPGPVTSATSVGPHDLIRDRGAVLVRDAADAADLFGRIGDDLGPDRHVADLDEEWSPSDRLVHDLVPVRRPAELDELVEGSGLRTTEVLAALSRLEWAGAVQHRGDGWQKTPSGRGSADRLPIRATVGE